MAQVTGMTAEAIEQRLNDMIVSMRIDENGQVIYKTKGGAETNAGALVSTNLATEKAWPVGSIYLGTVPTNPGEVLGVGTWVRHGKGRVLVSQDDSQTEFNAVDKIGGSKNYTINWSNIPSHNHSVGNHRHGYNLSYNELSFRNGDGAQFSRISYISLGSGATEKRNSQTDLDGGGNTSSVGSSNPSPINNMPPYIVVYAWKRTA